MAEKRIFGADEIEWQGAGLYVRVPAKGREPYWTKTRDIDVVEQALKNGRSVAYVEDFDTLFEDEIDEDPQQAYAR